MYWQQIAEYELHQVMMEDKVNGLEPVPNAAEVLARHLEGNPAARAEWEACQKLRNDPRVTPFRPHLAAKHLEGQVTAILPGYIRSEMNPEPGTMIANTVPAVRSMVRAIEREPARAIVPTWPFRLLGPVMRVVPARLLSRFF